MTDNISNNDENFENLDKIEIFSNTDKRLKFLGKILNNDYSRQILLLLIEKEMTANEIANQIKLSLPLVLHHVNQMIEAEIVVVSKISTNSKNQPMKHYSAKSGIIILPEKVVENARNSKSLSKSLMKIMKFAVIGIAAFTSWIFREYDILRESDVTVRTGSSSVQLDPLLIPLVIIIIGLIIERITSSLKNKKSGG